MKSERDLSPTDRDTIRQIFTRKVPDNTNVIRLDDECATRKFLNEYRQHEEKQNRIAVATDGFNPDIHVVITKEQLDITKQLQALTSMAKQVEDLHRERHKPNPEITAIKTGVDFVVARYTKPDNTNPVETSKEEKKLALKAKWITPRK